MVPVRFISEYLGAIVTWHDASILNSLEHIRFTETGINT
nr:hypothetical protein [Syntrophomonas wolfei]